VYIVVQIPWKYPYGVRKEVKLAKSIQYRIKKEKYIIRVTDKSGIFHLGHAKDYEQKAEAYRHKTCTYIELKSDPLWPIFDKVLHLSDSGMETRQSGFSLFIFHTQTS
jgi:hypothetical protein